MGSFKWTKANSAFIPEVDAQHRTLYRFGDELQEAVGSGTGSERVLSIMQALIASAEDHFSHEERLIRSTRYTMMAWHKQQHDGIRRRLKEFLAAFEDGDREAPRACGEYFAHWMKGHIALADRMMGAYLRNYQRHRAAS